MNDVTPIPVGSYKKETYTISLIETEETFLCNGTQTVLDSMAALGRSGIPSGCHGGGCGVCKVEVVEGCFDALAMSRKHISKEDEECGRVLACRIFPTSDLKLKVIGKLKKKVYAFNVG